MDLDEKDLAELDSLGSPDMDLDEKDLAELDALGSPDVSESLESPAGDQLVVGITAEQHLLQLAKIQTTYAQETRDAVVSILGWVRFFGWSAVTSSVLAVLFFFLVDLQ